MNKVSSRRNGLKIMASLILLLGSLAYVMILAIINGSLGYIAAMGVTLMGAFGIAQFISGTIFMPYEVILTLAVVFGVIRGILRYFEQYSNHYIAFTLLATLRDKIFGALRVLCPAKLETKKKGSIISLITSDIETLEVFYAHTISPICIAILISTSVFVFVGCISSWYLALTALVSYLIIGVVLPIFTSKRLKNSGVSYRKELSSFNAYFLDSIKGVRDIVIHNGTSSRIQEVNRRSDLLLKETKNIKNDSTLASAITELIVSLSIFLSLGVGVTLVINNLLAFENMLIGVIAIFGSFGPVIAISALPSNLTQTFASGDRVLNLLKEEPVVKEITDKNDFDFDSLQVENLSFGYEEDNEILHDINLNLKQGEIIGIVGPSGCGKSTLLKLLMRFFAKNQGQINYGNLEIEDINTKSLLDNVSMVSQSTYLFDETIKENLKIAKSDATDEELIDACKKASIHDFIMSLENGYDTKVTMLGDNVSAGEKQRLGLARAFLSGSKVILLDEPTSNVDSINEGIILRSLIEQKGKKSIILVSHRESTMAICTRIYSIEQGHIKIVK